MQVLSVVPVYIMYFMWQGEFWYFIYYYYCCVLFVWNIRYLGMISRKVFDFDILQNSGTNQIKFRLRCLTFYSFSVYSRIIWKNLRCTGWWYYIMMCHVSWFSYVLIFVVCFCSWNLLESFVSEVVWNVLIIMAEPVLTRVHSLRERMDSTLANHRNEILMFLSRYSSSYIIMCNNRVCFFCARVSLFSSNVQNNKVSSRMSQNNPIKT